MIPKVTHGKDAAPLLRYLFGPGHHNEHVEQHVVAGYDKPEWMQPAQRADGSFDVRELMLDLAAPVRRSQAAGGRPPREPVWHCSLSLREEEGRLSDEKWRAIATEFVQEMGFASADPYEDTCRWVAVRHGLSDGGNDHIHLVVTLVTEQGRNASYWRDFPRAQQAARLLEKRHGLHQVVVDDAARRPAASQAEYAAAKRRGRDVPDRVWLRQQVRLAAGGARSEAEWVARLHEAGVAVRVRTDKQEPTRVTGYAVAVSGEDPVWYGGSKLDADLSLPRLRSRWPGTELPAHQWQAPPVHAAKPDPGGRPTPQWTVLREATETVEAARDQAARIDGDLVDVQAAAAGATDVMAALARTAGPSWRDALTKATDDLARAAAPVREHRHRPPTRHGQALSRTLTQVARHVAAIGAVTGDREQRALITLIYSTLRLVAAIAALHEATGRPAAAERASTAGKHVVPQLHADKHRLLPRVQPARTTTHTMPAPARTTHPLHTPGTPERHQDQGFSR